MSIASRITAIQEHIGDIYDTLEIGGTDTSEIDKNIVNINAEIKNQYKYFLAHGTEQLWQDWEKITATGINLALTPTTEGKMEFTKLSGDTFQQTYTGKNILYLTDGTYNNNGIRAVVENNIITVTGTSTAQSLIDIKLIDIISADDTTLTKSLNPSGTYTGLQTSLRRTTPANSAGLWSTSASNISGTLSADAYYFRIQVDSGISINATLKAQVEVGSTATSFEPYVGNQPSPNPDYPQDIQVVTGNNNIKIENKNLYNYNEIYYYRNNYQDYVTVATNNNNITIVNNQSGGNGAVLWNIPVEIGENITISYSDMIETNTSTLNCIQYDFSDELITSFSTIPGKMIDKTLKKISVTSTKKYLNLILRTGNGNSYTISDLMVEYGNQATTYIQHQEQNYPISLGSIELAKIGNYQDKIIKKSDGWYVRKEIGKIVLDGTETTWNIDSNNIYIKINNALGTYSSKPKSNYYIYGSSSGNYGTIRFGNTNPNLFFNKSGTIYSVNSWKTYLQGLYNNNQPVIVYYELATPTETKITDTTLINQLNAIEEATGYTGTTYIVSTNENNLAIIPTLKVLKDI